MLELVDNKNAASLTGRGCASIKSRGPARIAHAGIPEPGARSLRKEFQLVLSLPRFRCVPEGLTSFAEFLNELSFPLVSDHRRSPFPRVGSRRRLRAPRALRYAQNTQAGPSKSTPFFAERNLADYVLPDYVLEIDAGSAKVFFSIPEKNPPPSGFNAARERGRAPLHRGRGQRASQLRAFQQS